MKPSDRPRYDGEDQLPDPFRTERASQQFILVGTNMKQTETSQLEYLILGNLEMYLSVKIMSRKMTS